MIQYISEFGLPKEFSKKKKFDLLIGLFIPQTEWKDKEIDWNINMDLQKVFLTVEDCARDVLDHLLNEGKTPDELKDSYIAIAAFTYPATYLNDVALARDTHDKPIDCELDKDKLSFNFTIRVPLNYSSLHGWEDLGISTLKIDTINTKEKDGKIIVTSFNVYPVIDNTTM